MMPRERQVRQELGREAGHFAQGWRRNLPRLVSRCLIRQLLQKFLLRLECRAQLLNLLLLSGQKSF